MYSKVLIHTQQIVGRRTVIVGIFFNTLLNILNGKSKLFGVFYYVFV
jgi:hypothetical protein